MTIGPGGIAMASEQQCQDKCLNVAFDEGFTSAQEGYVSDNVAIGAGGLEIFNNKQKH